MYDNHEMAKQKLLGTLCYYDGRAVLVKEVKVKYEGEEDKPVQKFCAFIVGIEIPAKTNMVYLDDPKFQFMEFNTGYINYAGYALWYYRIPSRQWKQGIHKTQFALRDASKLTNEYHQYDNFGNNECTAKMLENRYPGFDESVEQLKDPAFTKVAFHKDFAVYKDKFRKDCIIEYKGIPAAFWDKEGMFVCTDHMKYLRESIQEMNIKVA